MSMEEEDERPCKVIYFCTTAQDAVNLLFEARSPPPLRQSAEPSTSTHKDAPLELILDNARALLDQDRGGFQEVYISSSPDQCLDRLDSYANAKTTIVLVEVLRSHPSTHPEHQRDPGFDFLQTLGTSIQGARFQRHVIPFVILPESSNIPQTPSPDATGTAEYLSAGAAEILISPISLRDMNRLVGHVMDKTKPPARLVGCSMAQNLVESIRQTNTNGWTDHRPDIAKGRERLNFVADAISTWAFPAHDLDADDLTCAAMLMIEHQLQAEELQEYRIDRAELIAFLLATRRQYKHEREVTYHNWRHAIDVTQSIYQFLLFVGLCPPSHSTDSTRKQRSSVEKLLQPLDGLVLLVSAIGHDVGHPGVNNAFLVACNHPLAQLYNDKSVLENYHCSAYSQLLRRHWKSLSSYPPFRSVLISNILATDMQRHFEYMSNLNDLRGKFIDSDMHIDHWDDKDRDQARELMMALLMKAADISNIARPFDISAAWAKILIGEFAHQGELENELDIPTCLFGGPPDRDDLLAAAHSQKGFMNIFGLPLFRGLSDIMPNLSCSVETLERNLHYWDDRIADETRKRDAPEQSHATFASLGRDHDVEVLRKHHTSEPAVVPVDASQPPSTSQRWQPGRTLSGHSIKHPGADEHTRFTTGLPVRDDGKRASAPNVGPGGLNLSAMPSSRRSSKDVALGQLKQLSLFAHQNLPGSRQGSQDANYQLNQSYPSSRRGSKDESLTTILVTSKGSPGRNSPSSQSAKGSRQINSSPQRNLEKQRSGGRKPSEARSSISHSHATSSTTTATTAMSQQSPWTQPSSVGPHDTEDGTHDAADETSHLAIPLGDSPTLATGSGYLPRSTSSTTQSTISGGGIVEHASEASSTLPTAAKNDTSPRESPRAATADSDDRADSRNKVGSVTPQKDEQDAAGRPPLAKAEHSSSLRETRSRSRLRSLRFWKKKRDTPPGLEHGHHDALSGPS